LQSAALQQPLTGRVVRIDSVVGRPELRSPNPLAPVDFRAVGVTIELDAESAARAARWIQLQVDVTIHTPQPNSAEAAAPQNETALAPPVPDVRAAGARS